MRLLLLLSSVCVLSACSTQTTATSKTPTSPTSDTGGGELRDERDGGTDTFVLPLEVLGPAGTSVTIRVRLDNPAAITHLYLQCHACGYHDRALDGDPGRTKAALRINNGPEIPLHHYTGGDGGVVGNTALRVLPPAEAFGGIGGGFRTVRMTLPATGLVKGVNSFTFTHARPDDLSLGFRIVDFDLLTRDDPAAGTLTLSMDDPRTFTAPVDADARRGQLLWTARDSLTDPAYDKLDGPTRSGQVHAACADCHARDGRDLSYFGYSNQAIIARAVHHGLTRAQGENIAAYIRSNGVAPAPGGRPWNPPYQPGPGLDARPVAEWAAGAGVDAVLENDGALEAHLFPNGTSPNAVRAVVDRYATLNMRVLPVALELPDWNQWLPRIHPDDAFDMNRDVIKQDDEGQPDVVPPGTVPFYTALYESARSEGTSAGLDVFFNRLARWLERDATCFSQTISNGPAMRANDGQPYTALVFSGAPQLSQPCAEYRHDPNRMWAVQLAKASLSAWLSVKEWEIVQEHHLEEDSRTIGTHVCSGGRCVDASEARGWGTTTQNVFFRAAHYTGFDARRFTWEDELVSAVGNNAWYHLQLVLNPGYRLSQPSHFPYTLNWVDNLAELSGVNEPFRFWATYIKMRQLQTNGVYGAEVGLDLRTAEPFWLYSEPRGSTRTRAIPGRPRVWKTIAEALLADLLADMANATQAQWDAASMNSEVEPANSPASEFIACDDVCFDQPRNPYPAFAFRTVGHQGANTFRVIPRLRSVVGVDESLLNALIDWASARWVNGQWSTLRQ